MVEDVIRMEPEFRDAFVALADEVERLLGLSDLHMAMGLHARRGSGAATMYDLSVAVDRQPEFMRALRKTFPRRTNGTLRVWMGPFGDINFENVTLADVRAAHDKVRGS